MREIECESILSNFESGIGSGRVVETIQPHLDRPIHPTVTHLQVIYTLGPGTYHQTKIQNPTPTCKSLKVCNTDWPILRVAVAGWWGPVSHT